MSDTTTTKKRPAARTSTGERTDKMPNRKMKRTKQYTYSRGRDGVDDTWDIYDPYGEFVVSIRFWEEPDTNEGVKSEARAKLIVDTLNAGYWW